MSDQMQNPHAWVDEDEYHVWFQHVCADGESHTDMLPWPGWHAEDGKVKPSIDCASCGFHQIVSA